MRRAICFDLDGTLFDDRQYVRAGLRNAATRLEAGADIDLTDEFLTAYFDRDIREETFDTVLTEQGISESWVPKLVTAYHNNGADLSPFPGTKETLSTLAKSYEMGVITGGRNGIDKLERLGIAEYFDTAHVTSGQDHSKLDPEPFKRALDTLDVRPEAAVYVGDRPNLDFPQPNRLGMSTVRVKTGQYAGVNASGATEPDVTIPTVQELSVLVERVDLRNCDSRSLTGH